MQGKGNKKKLPNFTAALRSLYSFSAPLREKY